VFLFVVLMVTREGMETAFITRVPLPQNRHPRTSRWGAFGGLGLAAALAWAWVRYGQLVNLALFFKVTSVFLVLFALQLVIYSFHEATKRTFCRSTTRIGTWPLILMAPEGSTAR